MAVLLCPHCEVDVSGEPLPLSRHAVCQQCFQPLRCCLLCRHFDEAHAFQCLEDRSEPPLEKANANFCEFFSPKFGGQRLRKTPKNADAEQALNALFGDTIENRDPTADRESQMTSPSAQKNRWDALFEDD